MLIRYKQGKDGPDAVARIYSRAENNIDNTLVDRNAITVIRRLTEAGYESYLVGGAVRDMLLGRIPKDFDYSSVHGLTTEVLTKLQKYRPASLGEAERIPGVTPAALNAIWIALR